jgi:putative ABC transport system permease protein
MLTLLRRLSVRHLGGAPLRSALVVLGIALGVAVVVATRATSASMVASFDELVERTSARADRIVVGGQAGIPSELVAEIAAVDAVEHASAALEITTRFAGGDGSRSPSEPLLILGVDFLGDPYFLPFRGEGEDDRLVEDPLAFANDPSALLITRALATRRKLDVGSEVRVLGADGPVTLHVRGILRDEGPAQSFGGQVAVMFLDAAQVAFARGTLVDRIEIALRAGHDEARADARIAQVLAGRARLERPAQSGERLRALASPLNDGLELSGIVALLVGVFIIYNAVAIAVLQRRRETGILRALGVLQRQVVLHFTLEATLLALLGIGAGLLLAERLVVLTHAQATTAMAFLSSARPGAPRIGPNDALVGALAGLAITWLAALLPAWRGARLDPVAALRKTAHAFDRGMARANLLALLGFATMAAGWALALLGVWAPWGGYIATVLDLAGAALLAPFLIVRLHALSVRSVERVFGVPGRLGLDYVRRELARSTVNVLALMIAVALSVAVSGWLGSFEHAVRAWFEQVSAADFTVTAGSPVLDGKHLPLSAQTVKKLEGIEGVAALQPMRLVEQRYGETTLRLVASETRPYLEQARRKQREWRVLDGKSPIEPHELADGTQIVLGENAAHRLGLGAGDRMQLESPTGVVELTVRAVVVDYSSDVGAGFIDRALYVERWKDEALDIVNVYLEPGAEAERVASTVRARLGDSDAVFVTGAVALREQFLGLLTESFAYARSLELIVLFIALLGVVGTMIAAVIDRTRELGMLRAVGASRAQIARALVIEAAFIGICAVVLGTAAGATQCKMFLEILVAEQSGWRIDFVFPLEGTLRMGALVVAAGALAGLFPGMRAARLEIKEALALD